MQSVFLADFFLGVEMCYRNGPPACGFAGPGAFSFSGGVLLSDFLISLLNLCLIPFRETSNVLIFVPTASLTVVFLFVVVRRLVHGGSVLR